MRKFRWRLSIGSGIKQLKKLRHLTMNLQECSELVDVSSFGSAFEELEELEHLDMKFYCCSRLSDVGALGRAGDVVYKHQRKEGA